MLIRNSDFGAIKVSVLVLNFFLFGLTADQVVKCRAEGYQPWEIYNSNPELREVIDLISSGAVSRGDTDLFRPLTESLIHHDPFLALADYQSYVDCQPKWIAHTATASVGAVCPSSMWRG